MTEDNHDVQIVKTHILEQMEEAGIVTRDGTTHSYFKDGREYLLLISVIDITDWQQEVDPEDG